MAKRGTRQPSVKLRHTAVHEAAHATIARVLTLVAGGVTIKANYELGEAGYSVTADPYLCEYQWEVRGKVRETDAVWHARIIAFMAGVEAELIILGSTTGGDADDRLQIELMASELRLGSWDRLEPRLRTMTRTLVLRHRERIERVAQNLVDKRELSGEQVDMLVGRSVNDVKVNAPGLLELHRQAASRRTR